VARLGRASSLAATLALAGLGLSACGTGSALTQARQACKDVNASLKIYATSQQPGLSATRRSTLEASAMSRLLKATPAAAAATSLDGSWNPLMTTINEAERVPLKNLVPALTRLCGVADSSTPYL